MNIIPRRNDIDWLRLLAMLAMFFRHSARIFNYTDWYIKNGSLDLVSSLFITFTDQWVMPLFFVVSGMGNYYALQHHTGWRYIWERFKRLGIPLLFGRIILVPLEHYVRSVSHSEFNGSFVEYYLQYFRSVTVVSDLGSYAHLWFLLVLLVFCLVSLPFFRYLRRDWPSRAISRLAIWAEKPGVIFLLVIPLLGAEVISHFWPRGILARLWGSWSLFTYAAFFVLGYLIASEVQLKAAIERHARVALLLALFTISIGFLGFLSPHAQITFPRYLRVLDTWFWMVAILGLGSRYLSFRNRFLEYATTAVLPFYVLHEPVIVVTGFFIVHGDSPGLAKYGLICTISFIVIIALYHFLIRPIGLARLLFGLKMTQPSRQPLVL